MKSQALAVLLGLSTVANVPAVIAQPTEIPPAQQQQAAPPVAAVTNRLTTLARELTTNEATRRALGSRLNALDAQVPEFQKPVAVGGPQFADAFVNQLAAASQQAAHPLAITMMTGEDREQVEITESNTLTDETDKDALLARYQSLDAPQAELWAQLVCHAFTEREVDDIFVYRLKPADMANPANATRTKLLTEGVKLRRTLARDLEQIAEVLSPSGKAKAEQPADLFALLTAASEQTKAPIANVREAAGTAADKADVSDEERKQLDALTSNAKVLKDALVAATDAHAQLSGELSLQDRFTKRGDLQTALLSAAAAAAQIDQHLAALAEAWKIEVDMASKLPALGMVVVKRPQPPMRQNRPEPKANEPERDPLTVDSLWSGTQVGEHNGKRTESQVDGAKIISRNGDTIVIRTARPVANSHLLWRLRIDGGKLTLVSAEATNDPGATYVVRGGDGTIDGDTLTFDYKNENFRDGKLVSRSSATFTLKRVRGKAEAARAVDAGVGAKFPLDSTWTGTWTNNGNARGGRRTTGHVLRHEGQVVVMSVQTTDYALRHLYIQVNGNSLKLLRNEGVGNIPGTNTPAMQLTNIRMTGRIAATVMTITGTSDLFTSKGANMGGEEGTFKLTRD